MGIGKYFVSLFGFLEVFLRLWTVRITVWMVLHRQLAISFLYFIFAGVTVEAQHFIVVAFAHMDFLKNGSAGDSFLLLSSDKMPSAGSAEE
jgi:hypothetical protein